MSRPKCSRDCFWLKIPQLELGDRARDAGDVSELVKSIEKYGVFHPLVVSDLDEADKYMLVAGGRRLKALLLLQHDEIPVCRRDDLPELERKEAEYEENFQRKDLTWQETCKNLKQLDEIKRKLYGNAMSGQSVPDQEDGRGWSLEKTAKVAQTTKGTVSKKINLARTLEARPDIAEKVKNMPLHVAMRQVEYTLQAEKTDRLAKSGEIVLTTEVLLGSALDLVKEIGSESVDLMLTDPPFGMTTLEEERGQEKTGVLSYRTTLKEADNLTADGVCGLMKELLPEVFRVLKPSAHFYMFFAFELYPQLSSLLKLVGFEFSFSPLIWNKGRPTSGFKGYEYMPCYEPVIFGWKPPKERRLATPAKTILDYEPVKVRSKIHAFEKPLDLLEKLISQSTQRGELVWDPFAGSGSTVVAAKRQGRRGLGFELDREHWLLAQSRLQEEGKQQDGKSEDSV